MISVIVVILIIIGSNGTLGNGGGVGDSDLAYDCGGSCHTSQGDGVIDMTASTLNPSAGQTITVTITFTENSLDQDIVGVFLLKNLDTGDSQPSSDGWNILGDPNGGTVSYVEKEAVSGVQTEFAWTMKAPTTPGTYSLYTRVHHGPGVLYEEDASGLTFEVSEAISGIPMIEHAPVTKAHTGAPILIEATLKDTTSAYIYWKYGSDADFDKVVLMSKVSEEADGQWKFEGEIPAQDEVGTIEYFINATKGDLFTVSPSSRITLTEEPVRPSLMAWGLQIIISLEAIAIIAFIAIKFTANNGRIRNEGGRTRNG
jgi:hypothetical protein